MQITIELFATLREGRFDIATKELPAGTTVSEIIHLLGIPENAVTLVFVNGRHAESSATLTDGDTIGLFPSVGGG